MCTLYFYIILLKIVKLYVKYDIASVLIFRILKTILSLYARYVNIRLKAG